MKKLIIVELALLAVLLVAAIIACGRLSKPVSGPEETKDSINTTGETTGANKDETTQGNAVTVFVPGNATTAFVPSWKTYPADRQLLAKQYFVYDCKAGTFLINSGKTNDRIYPASITKLFTAYVAMQYLQPDAKITAGSALDLVAWGSSVAKIKKGDVLTVQQLVEAMLLPSGNDAAYLLACEAGRVIKKNYSLSASSAVKAFVDQMNTQAKALGMTGTNFVNPDGIHSSNHYTTFGDLAILGKLALADKTVMQYAATPKEQVVLHGETVEWKNTNALINPETPYYCPYAVGLKTGQTPSAGSCLLAAFRMDGRELLIGVFGCPKEEDRFDDTLQLFNSIVLD